MIVFFIRHGSTLWNEEGRMQGRRDIPLSDRGRDQVRAWRVPEPEAPVAWVSSPLCRAAETARILRGSDVPHEPALTEMDWGEWEGARVDDLRDHPGAAYAQNEARGLDFRPPGGESPRDVLLRLQPWLERVGTLTAPLVAVTHLGVLRAILSAATGWDMTGKVPVRLLANTLHRFAVDERGKVSIVACNVPL
jgi:broad specificity phosphatase PhoE